MLTGQRGEGLQRGVARDGVLCISQKLVVFVCWH